MEQSNRKRITVKLKSPNPLFEKWLMEWRNKAKEHDSKMQYTFNAALKSLRKYPIPLNSGRECMILKGFGTKLCEMLDKKLKDHKTNDNANATLDYEYDEINQPKQTAKKKRTPKKVSKTNKTYTPAYRSGGYAILLTLLKKSQEPNYPGFSAKDEIIQIARQYCDKSFTKSEPGSFYTAWSSMSTLVSKNLVEKKSSPPKFSLTPEGFDIAIKLIDNENENNDNFNKPSTSTEGIPYLDKEINQVNEGTELKISSSQNSSQDENITNQNTSDIDTILFAPGSFDIVLLVDNQETEG